MKRMVLVILVLVSGFAGGFTSNMLLHRVAEARDYSDLLGKNVFLYTEEGEQRLQLGTYAGNYSVSEAGLPLIGLFDNSDRLRLLMRLAGENESPVLIFKDSSGRDRIVMGLGLNNEAEEPFLTYTDSNGKKNLFGSY